MRIAAAFVLLSASAAFAGATPEQIEFFETRIRPVLAQECYECHSSTGKKKGGLVLDTRAALLEGGTSGPALIPGKPNESLLLQSIRHDDAELKMPKNGAKLDANVIRDFEKWIAMGAPDPRDQPPTPQELAKDTDWPAVMQRRKSWWSLQPVRSHPVPKVKALDWSENPVDRFLLARLEADNLKPNTDADARIIFRRLSFALTGLPPIPAEIDAFVTAAKENPQVAVVAAADKLLASPRFGERWARHWMDWVRYAETHGSEGDPQIPHAWRYRDYLIRALNADVPYGQLVREHIAGDLLDNPRINRELGINESALGPAHLRMVLHGYTPTDALDEQVTFVDNQIDTVTKAFLGLTVSCARCHNHKFDAISQADFYALYGIMNSCRPATIDINLPERQKHNAGKLAELKSRIRGEMASIWLTKIDAAVAQLRGWNFAGQKQPPPPLSGWTRLSSLAPEKWDGEWNRMKAEARNEQQRLDDLRTKDALFVANLRGDDVKKWVRDGTGLHQGATPPGEFHVLPDGERVLSNIYPAGVYSHLLSSKHRAVLGSQNFVSDGGRLWVRVRGGNKARVRYVVHNYPRTGLIFPRNELNNETDEWFQHSLDYWKGERIHIEVSTEADLAVETGNAERSWFGIAEVIYTKSAQFPEIIRAGCLATINPDAAAPKNIDDLAALYTQTLRGCIEAWRDGRMTDDQAEMLGAFVQRDWLPNKLAELQSCAPLIAEYRRLEAEIPAPTRAPGVLEGFAADQPLFTRGNHKQPAELIPRRFLEAIDARPYAAGTQHSGRRQLADSMAPANNPLAARVIVNRVWHHVFGRGIVGTPDNFGRLGEAPTHPELLDYLAARFVAEGGSLKQLIRLLVTSRAFRLDHRPSTEANARDPENKLFSHFSARRLDAEVIRDSMLALTGKLDTNLGGPPIGGGDYRRSVYMRVHRNQLDPLLTAFDFPVPSAPRGKRDSTNVPAQSLALLNAPLVKTWAAEFARRILLDTKDATDDVRVQRMFADAFGRAPNANELNESLSYIHSQQEAPAAFRESAEEVSAEVVRLRHELVEVPANDPRHAMLEAEISELDERQRQLLGEYYAAQAADYPWRNFARALFNAKEFIYVR